MPARSRIIRANRLLPLLLLLGLTTAMQAQFDYTVENGTVTITEYTGPGGDVSIPETINGLPVTSIGWGAFYGCTSLTSVTIPDSVTEIKGGAFGGCTGLIAITVDVLNPAYRSLDGVLLDKDQTTLNMFPPGRAGTYTIPDSVTSIAGNAFWGCTSLISVTIPDSVTSIGEVAFAGCASLTSVTIGNGVTSIGSSAFADCSSLTRVTIPNNVTSIGEGEFYGCTSLTSITIGNGVTSIGYGAFSWCASLTSVTIPNSVTSIGEEAFYGCTSLTSVTIPDSVTSIGTAAFEGCTSLTSVYFEGNAPNVGGHPFDANGTVTVYYRCGTTGWGHSFAGALTISDMATRTHVPLTPLGSLTLSNDSRICGAQMLGDYVFIADTGNGGPGRGVVVVGVANPSSPVRLANLSLSVDPIFLRVATSNHVLLGWSRYDYDEATFSFGLGVIDISNPINPTWMNGVTTIDSPINLDVRGNYAYLTTGCSWYDEATQSTTNTLQLQVIDISNPTTLIVAASLSLDLVRGTNGSPGAVVCVEGERAYIASSSSIAVLDISDPAFPRIVMVKPLPSEMSEIMQGGYATNARIFNGHLYLCYRTHMYGGAVAIFECSEPSLLTYCGKVDTTCRATSIDFYDQYAFVASHEDIEVFYASDTGELCRVAILPGYWDTSDLLIKNARIYLADSSGVHILGIAAPPRITRQTINGNMLSLEWNETAEGMRLQHATSLSNPNWQELLGSETTNAVSLPIWSGTQFFRLMKP